MICVLGAVLYYGWPIIEVGLACIPSSKKLNQIASDWLRSLKTQLTDTSASLRKNKESISRPHGYQ